MFALGFIVTSLFFVFVGLAGLVLTEGSDHLEINSWAKVVTKAGTIALCVGLAIGCVQINIAMW